MCSTSIQKIWLNNYINNCITYVHRHRNIVFIQVTREWWTGCRYRMVKSAYTMMWCLHTYIHIYTYVYIYIWTHVCLLQRPICIYRLVPGPGTTYDGVGGWGGMLTFMWTCRSSGCYAHAEWGGGGRWGGMLTFMWTCRSSWLYAHAGWDGGVGWDVNVHVNLQMMIILMLMMMMWWWWWWNLSIPRRNFVTELTSFTNLIRVCAVLGPRTRLYIHRYTLFTWQFKIITLGLLNAFLKDQKVSDVKPRDYKVKTTHIWTVLLSNFHRCRIKSHVWYCLY